MSDLTRDDDNSDDETADLGVCCACRTRPAIGLVMLAVRAPVPGTGWGCVVCGLPQDGAVAVLCEDCGENEHMEILDVCSGYPKDNVRVLRVTCATPFVHIRQRHLELEVNLDGFELEDRP